MTKNENNSSSQKVLGFSCFIRSFSFRLSKIRDFNGFSLISGCVSDGSDAIVDFDSHCQVAKPLKSHDF